MADTRKARRAKAAGMRDAATRPVGLPSREALAAFIRDNPASANKRDIAKAFGLKGDDRVLLKHLLKEMEEDGAFEKQGKRLALPGALPPVTVVEITGRDGDGGLIGRPAEWDEVGQGPAPRIFLSTPKPGRTKQVTAGVGSRVLARLSPGQKAGTYSARVIKRLEQRAAAILGVVKQLEDKSWRLVPVDRKQDELDIDPTRLNEAKDGDLVEVSTVKSGRYGLARAHVEVIVGSMNSEKAVSMIAIHAHGIPHIFPQAVLDEAASVQPPKLGKPREDWRALPLITIDPADAKDHDDAVHGEPDTDPDNVGGHIVTVAIADVAHFIRPGSALDREAVKRGNSVYFPDRVVPMLPERISNDLCSLREGEDRPALAVRMIFDANGRKRRHTFHRIYMRSAAKLSYNQAQAAIDGATDDTTGPLLEPVLKPLWAAYATMLKGRNHRGPLELDLPERKILLKSDGTVDRVIVPPRLDAHKLIEECMIQANVAAAETLEEKQQMLVFRVHDTPSMAKQEALREFLKTLNIALARGAQLRPSAFNAILQGVKGEDHEALVHGVVLRSQAQAEYSPDNYGHFGLNLRRYAHFTSPIRRYADLIVHRALVKALGFGESGEMLPDIEIDALREIAGQISNAERRAVNAERSTVDRLIAQHLADSIGETFDGRIAGMAGAGLFVTLNETGADGFIPISKLGDEYFHHDEAAHAMVGERSGHGFRLGDPVEVRVAEVQALAGAIRFDMVSEPRDMGMSTRSFHKAKRAGGRNTGKGPGRGPGSKQGNASRKRR